MVSEYLKQNTSEFHDAAERLFNSEKIFNKTFTLDDYRKIIFINYLMLLHSEDKVFRSLSNEISNELQLDKRRKLHLIERDLKSLAIDRKEETHDLKVDNQHEALGMLYVIEGSTLGGNVIAKQLSKTEGFDGVTFNFFGCYKEKTGLMWTNFKEVLDRKVAEENYQYVLSGAKKLYTFLLNLN